MYSIAKNYDTTVSNIKTLNNLTSDTLTIGQVLQIPVTTTAVMETNTITYTVKAGDTLYSLAREYNTTVNNIKTLNNLSSDILSVGQTLLISS